MDFISWYLFRSQKNCSDLWQLFTTAYTGLGECEVPMERYDPFVEEAFLDIPENKVNFLLFSLMIGIV